MVSIIIYDFNKKFYLKKKLFTFVPKKPFYE